MFCLIGNINLPRRSAYRRQKETSLASAAINGGSMENQKPAQHGMFATMKYGKTEDVNEYVNKSGQFRTVFASLSKKQVALYKKSNDNLICSLSVLYVGG